MSLLRLTYEAEWDDGDRQKVVVENNKPDSNIDDLWLMVKQLLAGVGFHHSSITELFGDDDGLDKD